MKKQIIISIFIILLSQICCTNKKQEEAIDGDRLKMTSKEKVLRPYEILNDKDKINIPFEIFRNDIRMVAQVNGRDCYILLDNGSLWDELLFFGSPKVDSMKLDITGETAIGDTTVENPVMADVATDITVNFDDVIFHDQKAIITRYIPGLPNLWEGADGQISAAFFKHFIVDINFDKSSITLISPEKFKYTGTG